MNAPIATTPTAGAGYLRFAALLATYMQAANLSLPNPALRFIQGSLSMSDDQAGWIFTSYLAASAITLPVAQWLAGRFGLKAVYQAALGFFMLGLLLDTLATTPLQFVGARVVQGAAGGVLAPLSMTIAMATLAPEQQGTFAPRWTALGLLGIVSAPALGGWLCEHYPWHWLFYSSLPVSAYILLVVTLLLNEKKAQQHTSFDFFGFTTFTLAMIALQMLLDRGERLDWFASTEICLEAVASAMGFYLFGIHVLTAKVHFFSKALFRDRNFMLSTAIFFALGFVLLSTMALTSPMLDEILGYPPDTTGYLTIPRGVGLIGAFVLMGRVPAWIDRRALVAAGIALVVYANWLMLGYSILMDWRPVALAGAIQGVGLGVLMPAISAMAFSTLPAQLRPQASGLFNLARVYGSTLGVAIVQIFFFSNTQAMHMALASNLTPYGGGAQGVSLPGLAGLNEMITGQAAFIAVISQFKILLWAMLLVSPLIVFLRKPVATH